MIYAKAVVPGLNRFYRGHFQNTPNIKTDFSAMLDRSVSVNVITKKFVGLKCLTETKIPILYDHVDHTCFHIVEMECQIVQILSTYIVGPTMFVSLTPALDTFWQRRQDTDGREK